MFTSQILTYIQDHLSLMHDKFTNKIIQDIHVPCAVKLKIKRKKMNDDSSDKVVVGQ